MNRSGAGLVAYFYVAGRLDHRALRALHEQYPAHAIYRQRAEHPTDYADDLRQVWRMPGDLVVVEQDVVVPRGAIAELLACDADWCTHPHWTGERYDTQTLGLAKFSAGLRFVYPHLADRALAGPWRQGPGPALPADGAQPVLSEDPRQWPTTAPWTECDSRLAVLLNREIGPPCVHHPPTLHLHPYGSQRERSGELLKPDPKL